MFPPMHKTQKSSAAAASPREGWEPWRETFREHGEDAHRPEWRDDALSPLSPFVPLGVAAVHGLARCVSAKSEASAALQIAAAVAGRFERGAPRNEGRHS